MKKLFFSILLFLISITWSNSQTLKVKAQFDSTTAIKIGDQIQFRIEIEQSQDIKVKIPTFADTLAQKIEILKASKPDTVNNNGIWNIRQDYLVTSFDSGVHKVEPIKFEYTLNGKTDTMVTEPSFLQVFTIPADTSKDIRDIKAPLTAPVSFGEVAPYLLVGIAIILIVFGIWYYLKKRKGENVFVFQKPEEPAHVLAIRDLEVLRSEKLWQQGKEKTYYTRLTEILRHYIELRFKIIALEMTTDEIITALKRLDLDIQSDLDILNTILIAADLVKFAKSQPLPDENEISMLKAFQFVNNTKEMRPLSIENETGNVE